MKLPLKDRVQHLGRSVRTTSQPGQMDFFGGLKTHKKTPKQTKRQY